jgi:multiple sugar transport system substrate-binding protein
VTSDAADILAPMNPRMDAVGGGSAPVSSLPGLNQQPHNLVEVAP